MNVLVLGSGGREHAISLSISKSPLLEKLYAAPGNIGTENIAENIELSLDDFDKIKEEILSKSIDVLVVGPEQPLVQGLNDFLKEDPGLSDLVIVGPNKEAAQLEGSKDFAKKFMLKNGIPTAAHKTFTQDTLEEGISYIDELETPIVLKADGLAAGKGVIISEDRSEAKHHLKEMLAGAFGSASSSVVIEEFLDGIELSVFILTNGKEYVILPEAKDYKRIGDQDQGPNTGGMGAVSPVPFADAAFLDKIDKKIIKPTLEGLNSDSIKYEGFIFFGLIKVGEEPYVIEYNCRLGDPETQIVLPRLESDLLSLMTDLFKNKKSNIECKISKKHGLALVMVSGGYPGKYEKGYEISGLELAEQKDITLFHAGTSRNQAEKIVNQGGRVLALSALADDLEKARTMAYDAAEKIEWQDRYYRKDIGYDILSFA